MGSGDPPGLQNRREAGWPVFGAFDSHTLPPIISVGYVEQTTFLLRIRTYLPQPL